MSRTASSSQVILDIIRDAHDRVHTSEDYWTRMTEHRVLLDAFGPLAAECIDAVGFGPPDGEEVDLRLPEWLGIL